MKNFRKILSFFILISILFSSFNIVEAEWEEENDDNNEETVIIKDPRATTIEMDPRVTVKYKKVITPKPKKEVENKRVYVTREMLANWPHKHKLSPSTKKIYHKPAWMYSVDSQYKCKKWTLYFVLDDNWDKLTKYSIDCEIEFSDEEMKKEFSDDVLEWTEEGENIEVGSESENNDVDEEVNSEEWTDEVEVDNFIEDLLGSNVNNRLKNIIIKDEKLFLSWKNMSSSIKSYSLQKEKIEISKFEINWIKNQDYYNWIVAKLFSKFNEKAKLNSSKNEISKALSKISFSFSSYVNDELDDSVREVFRKKFVKDLKELQVSYSKLSKEDSKVSNFLLNRG